MKYALLLNQPHSPHIPNYIQGKGNVIDFFVDHKEATEVAKTRNELVSADERRYNKTRYRVIELSEEQKLHLARTSPDLLRAWAAEHPEFASLTLHYTGPLESPAGADPLEDALTYRVPASVRAELKRILDFIGTLDGDERTVDLLGEEIDLAKASEQQLITWLIMAYFCRC